MLTEVWILIIIPLASWRLASIITAEKIFELPRSWIGIHLDKVTLLEIVPDTYLAYLFSCLRCMSVWTGLLCVGIYYLEPKILLPFAASSLAILFEEKL